MKYPNDPELNDARKKGVHHYSFLTTFLIVIVGVHVLVFGVFVIARVIGATRQDPQEQRAVLEQRLKPAGVVITDASQLPKAQPAVAQAALSGDQVVSQVCSACHQAGVLGAPKIGDHDAWATRLKNAGGFDGLLHSALNGKNAMPPRGGQPSLSDEEVRSAIQTMLKRGNVNVGT